MKIFNCRSPYIVSIDNGNTQIATKLEIKLWRVGNLESTAITKTIQKTKFGPDQYVNYYNISPFVYDLIDTFNDTILTFAYNIKVTKYSDTGEGFEDIGNEYLVSVNGYNDYENPNYNYTTDLALLGNYSNAVNYFYNTNTIPNIDFIIDFSDTTSNFSIEYNTTAFVVDHYEIYTSYINYSNDGLMYQERVPMVIAPTSGTIVSTEFNVFENNALYDTLLYTCILTPECEQKYNPLALDFVNRLGGKQTMTLFKNSTQTINVKSSDYNTNNFTNNYPTYNKYIGQKRIFNKNGTKTIKCNTGWFKESDNVNIQDVFLSELLYLTSADGTIDAAVTLRNSSQQIKTHLNNKVINYELEFEIASSLINNVV